MFPGEEGNMNKKCGNNGGSGPGLYAIICIGMILFCVTGLSGADEMVPLFSAIPNAGDAPLTVSFIDLSVGDIDGWNWTFGDGDTSDDQNPVHRYVTSGSYSPVLTIWNTTPDNNVTLFISNYITVNQPEPPVANFTATPSRGNADMNVTFIDLSTGADLSYAWDLDGDGTTDSTDRNPSIEYLNGTYDVSLTVTDWMGRIDSLEKQQYIWTGMSYPQAGFTATPLYGPAPLNVSCIDQSLVDPALDLSPVYSWDFGDNTPISSEKNPVHQYTQEGEYSITLLITSNGRSDDVEMSYPVVVTPPEPFLLIPGFTATPIAGDAPLTVSFIDQSSGPVDGWNWTFGDGDTSDDQNPVHRYVTAGTYSPVLRIWSGTPDTNATLFIDNYITVEEPQPPVANFTATPLRGNAGINVTFIDLSTGADLSYAWDLDGDGSIDSTDKNPVFLYANGTYDVTLTVEDWLSRSGTTVKEGFISVGQPYPFVDFTYAPSFGPAPLTVSFIDNTATDLTADREAEYSWDFGDGGRSSEWDPIHLYSIPGTYQVNLTVSDGDATKKVLKGDIVVTEQFLPQGLRHLSMKERDHYRYHSLISPSDRIQKRISGHLSWMVLSNILPHPNHQFLSWKKPAPGR